MADNLEVGREYLVRAPGVVVLAVYTGTFTPPSAEAEDDDGPELPRFLPVTWIRGCDCDPDWPFYVGPKATIQAVEVSKKGVKP